MRLANNWTKHHPHPYGNSGANCGRLSATQANTEWGEHLDSPRGQENVHLHNPWQKSELRPSTLALMNQYGTATDFPLPSPSRFRASRTVNATPADFMASSPDIGERFRAFVASEIEEYNDAESESDGSSAFAASKSFWLNFLQRQDSESQATDEDSRIRKTPQSRTVHRTWSNSSSISEASGFRKQMTGPFGLSSTPRSVASMPNEGTNIQRRRAAVANKWKTPPVSLPRNGNGSISAPKRRFSFTTPPTPSPRLGIQRRSTPRTFGGDVTNLSAPSSTPKAASTTTNASYQSGAQQAMDGLEHKPPTSTTSSHAIHYSQRSTNIPVHATCDRSGTPKENLGPTPSTRMRRATKAETPALWVDRKPQYRSDSADSPSVDPIIELGDGSGSIASSVSDVTSKVAVMKVSPTARYEDRFQWAYDVWYRAGLMQKRPQKRVTPSPIASNIQPQDPTPAPKPIYTTPSCNKKISTSKTLRPPTASVAVYERTAKPAEGNAEFPEIEPIESSEPDHSHFKDLLKQWRDKSDDKPNTHFLSPEQEAKSSDPSGSKETRTWSRIDKSIDRSGQLVKANPAYWKPRKSTPSLDPSHHSHLPKENDDSLEASREIRRSTTFGDDQPSSQYTRKSSDLVDSDKFEDTYAGEKDDCRALVILDSKQTYEVMVGDTRMGSGQDLVIRNVELVKQDPEDACDPNVCCECSQSVFSGNDDLISFFLPQMGMACNCGRHLRGLVNPDVPTSIENVLRPWQVEFLKSFGINRGEQLVKARHRSADVMAKALRRWRKQKNLAPFRTQSCGMAIHIWAKTCKTYVRSIRKQIEAGSDLLEGRNGIVLNELSHFLANLPPAPAKRRAAPRIEIEPESQVEV